MFSPRVSIGVYVYNGERFLEETLDSFLAQTFQDFEIVISDNASTDGTADIARAYAARDKRIRYYRNLKNLGLAENQNRAFALARGTYFKWAAADDTCLPDYLARCVEVLERDPTVVLAYPKTQFVDEVGQALAIDDPGFDLQDDEPQERLRYVIFAGHWVNAALGLIRTSALEKTRLMGRYSCADRRILAELSLLGKFFEIPEVLFRRRLHSGATTYHSASGPEHNPQWLAQYLTGKQNALSMPRWNLTMDMFLTIMRSQLSLAHKLSLLRSLLREMRWRRGKLWKELNEAASFFPARVCAAFTKHSSLT